MHNFQFLLVKIIDYEFKISRRRLVTGFFLLRYYFVVITGNSMGDLDGAEFSTYDQDNDDWVYNCADQRHGAWWYKSCTFANLNGMYLENGAEDFRGVYWFYWTHTVAGLKTVEMKIRPI